MASKTVELKVPLPIDISYLALSETGNSLKGWKTTKSDQQHFMLEWKTGNILTSAAITIVASLESVDDNETLVKCSASHMGLADAMGHLPKALQTLLSPYQDRITNLHSLRSLQQQGIDEGIICPTCKKVLKQGTKFCPDDGTRITAECPKCKQENAPGARFCINCGTKLES